MIKHSATNKISASGKLNGLYDYSQPRSSNVIRTKVNTTSSADNFISSKKPHFANVIKTKGGK